ncbi:PREDICTED: uncharacterized protein LOC108366982 [Rhagoletis zephyria]|uniref:uncharacterized protein LOC108366982 n=1 Tax=Rhagoletis zephyria TaxID=28612 RepID=UPI0008116737|nr:PREDICTED: uncharacterized protein LOC108366982 [Rhagoletis zephyria]
MEVSETDRAEIICTMALLHKYFEYGEPLSGSLISMSLTTAPFNIQQDLLNALHEQLDVPWTVVVRNIHQPSTSSGASATILHEKPQCYFVIIENLQDGDLEDVLEDWKTDINWNPLAQFVVYMASLEETDEEMTELMTEILLSFMNKNIYNVNVIGRNEENAFFYGKTVFPYHPDNNCGNRVTAIETLDICDFQDDSKYMDDDNEEEDGVLDDYDDDDYEEGGGDEYEQDGNGNVGRSGSEQIYENGGRDEVGNVEGDGDRDGDRRRDQSARGSEGRRGGKEAEEIENKREVEDSGVEVGKEGEEKGIEGEDGAGNESKGEVDGEDEGQAGKETEEEEKEEEEDDIEDEAESEETKEEGVEKREDPVKEKEEVENLGQMSVKRVNGETLDEDESEKEFESEGEGEDENDDDDDDDEGECEEEVEADAKNESEFEIEVVHESGGEREEKRKEEINHERKETNKKKEAIKGKDLDENSEGFNDESDAMKYVALRDKKVKNKNFRCSGNKKELKDIKILQSLSVKGYEIEDKNSGEKADFKLAIVENCSDGCDHSVSQKKINRIEIVKRFGVETNPNKIPENSINEKRRGTDASLNTKKIINKSGKAKVLIEAPDSVVTRFHSSKIYAPFDVLSPLKNGRARQKRSEQNNQDTTKDSTTQEIYLQELYRGLFLDKFPKDLSGCPIVAAYRPWEPYIFNEGKEKGSSVEDYHIAYESNEESAADVAVYEAKDSEENVQNESDSMDYDYATANDDSYTGMATDAGTDTDTDATAYNDVDDVGAGDAPPPKFNGIEYQLVQTIGKLLNITIELQVENSNLYHLFQQLIDGDVEMILGGIDEDPSLSQYVSSSIAYHQDDLTWCVAKAKRNYSLFNFLQSFHISTWIFTLAFILLSSLNIFVAQNVLNIRITHFVGFFATTMRVFGIVLSQSTSLSRLPYSLCITFGSTFVLALIFVNSYQSFLVSTLTTPQSSYQISHLDEIYRNRMAVTGSVENVRHLNKDGETFKYIRENFQMCYSIEECLNRAAADEHVAVAVSRQHSFYNPRILRDQLYCFDRNENLYVYLVTLLLPKKYHLLHKINPIIQHVIESGHMQKWARELDLKRKIREEIERAQKELVKSLKLNQVAGSFALHGMLAVLAFFIFLLERWTNWMVVKRRTRLRLVKMLHRQFS